MDLVQCRCFPLFDPVLVLACCLSLLDKMVPAVQYMGGQADQADQLSALTCTDTGRPLRAGLCAEARMAELFLV